MAKSTKPLPFPMFDADRLTAAQQRNLDAFASAMGSGSGQRVIRAR